MSETHIIPSTEVYAAQLPSDPENLFGFLSEAVSDALMPVTAYEAYFAGQIAELDAEIHCGIEPFWFSVTSLPGEFLIFGIRIFRFYIHLLSPRG